MENSRTKGKLIFIHGVSGSGKSTVGEMLKTLLLPWSTLIDQDQFYKAEKPSIILDGYKTKNWDCEDAIDFEAFRRAIREKLHDYLYIFVTGFALRKELMQIDADYSYLLEFDLKDEDAISQIINARLKSKEISDNERRDRLMVSEVVWPFYLETKKLIQPSKVIVVYGGNGRTNLWDIVVCILKDLV